ncbi:MAG TPA: DJ-1/PfpI family protein [Thermoanaerobaculia bacterium]
MRRPHSLFLISLILLTFALFTGCQAREPEGTPEQSAQAGAPPPIATPAPQTPFPQSGAEATPPDASAGTPLPPAPGAGPAQDLPKDRPLQVAFLVIDGVYNTELAAPYDVFHHTTFHTQPGMRVFTVSPNGQPVTTFEGLKLIPDYGFANAPQIDVLVVPSARGSMDKDLQNQAMIDWVRTVGSRARHVLSLCDGAFVLAKAGLLQGIPATTFPEDYERFSQMFPGIDLKVNVTFVDAGKVITSQGGARSYEAAIHLTDKLYGTPVAQGIGKGLLVPWPPDPDTMMPRIVTGPPADPQGTGGTGAPATPTPTTPLEPAANRTPSP